MIFSTVLNFKADPVPALSRFFYLWSFNDSKYRTTFVSGWSQFVSSVLSSPHKVVNAYDISKDFPMNSSIGNSEVLLEVYKERGSFRNWLAKTLAGIPHNQRTESHSRLSLLIVHELSLAVRSFAGPITAMELGTSWEARYLNKKHMSPSKKGLKVETNQNTVEFRK